MISLSEIRRRIADSAIEAALNAFWVAAYGAIITAGTAVGVFAARMYGFVKTWDSKWLYALVGAILAFLVVVCATGSVAWLRRKSPEPSRGRRGFLDSRLDIEKTLETIPVHLNTVSTEFERVAKLAGKMTLKLAKQRRTTTYYHRESAKAAMKFIKYAGVIRLHCGAVDNDLDILTRSLKECLVLAVQNCQAEQIADLRGAMLILVTSIDNSTPGIISFREGTDAIRWISKDLDVAGEQLAAAVDPMISRLKAARGFCQQQLDGVDS